MTVRSFQFKLDPSPPPLAMHRTTSVSTSRNRIVVSTKLEFKSFEGGNDLSETLTRNPQALERVLKDAGMEKDIDDVVIVGVYTRISNVESLPKDFFSGILAEQHRHSINAAKKAFPTTTPRTLSLTPNVSSLAGLRVKTSRKI
ncbi:ATPase with role in protein import into the ER [Tulasnella sp. UAMH 9824]|nr:ATPase with role in protein import into the ER [Tulasnella sp. UAMH 9824]